MNEADELRLSLARVNASDVEQFNEYERRIAELEQENERLTRHNELLLALHETSSEYIEASMLKLVFSVKLSEDIKKARDSWVNSVLTAIDEEAL